MGFEPTIRLRRTGKQAVILRPLPYENKATKTAVMTSIGVSTSKSRPLPSVAYRGKFTGGSMAPASLGGCGGAS